MSITPTGLVILLNTNIPGFKTIQFKPYMTIPNEISQGVQFNPLVKLTENKIQRIPDNIRVREFFDHALFTSLIYDTPTQIRPSLTEATQKGFIDKNILLTLKTIFPVKGKIYLNKEAYSIGNVSWTSGEWKVGLRDSLNKSDKERGLRQLSSLPLNVANGSKVKDPINKGTEKGTAKGTEKGTENVGETTFQYNEKSTSKIRSFLKNKFHLINKLFDNLDERSESILTNYNYTASSYNDSATVNGIQLVENVDGIECNSFFTAVSNGINSYNNMNETKIQIGSYGSGELLITVKILRLLIYNYVFTSYIKDASSEEIGRYFNKNLSNVSVLNDKFKELINKYPEISNDKYESLRNTFFISKSEYLVTYDKGIPSNRVDYLAPFRLVRVKELKKYILSTKYCGGDHQSVEAINQKLGISIISFRSHESNYTLLNNPLLFDNAWDKCMFLLKSGSIFELMEFNEDKRRRILSAKVCIFERFPGGDHSKYTPPIYILVMIFGLLYISLDDDMKRNFTLYPHMFELMSSSYRKIDDSTYKKDFVTTFPSIKPIFKGGGDESLLTYIINVDLMLKTGGDVSDKDVSNLSCDAKRLAISKSYNALIGKPSTLVTDVPKTKIGH